MSDNQKTIYNMLKALFRDQQVPTHSEVVEKAIKLSSMGFLEEPLSENEISEIVDAYEMNANVKAFDPDSLVAPTIHSEWLEEKKKQESREHSYWERYEDYLRDEKDFDESTIEIMKRSTEEILGYCANPTPQVGEVKKRKGLVVGDVQSGKTANYLALINMACDYDYKLIVILAGLTDSLRRQTQERIDEGFIGAASNTIGSSYIKYVGVGVQKNDRFAVTLTNLDNDFKRESLATLNSTTADFNKPVILVVKKNKSTLTNLKQWLKPGTEGVTNHILIIDDEADNASINTRKADEDPSTINSLIRELFNNFETASYVGYTATPFANIFINPDDEESYRDLFPTDFITLLKTPTSYFGAEKVFGPYNDGDTKYIRVLDENEPDFLPVNHKKDYSFTALSKSLKEAILSFFLNSTIRSLRGQKNAHRSMMINISRFNKVQLDIRDKVCAYVEDLKNVIEQDSYRAKEQFLRNADMRQMYNLYMNDPYYDSIRTEFSWKDIQSALGYEASKMKVLVINGLKDEEKLDYRSLKDIGARYIVIGGFVLSRGLTLEGLLISYYSRNGSAYDSLFQMCRWFGYRPKYEDLCRIYMSDINIQCFSAVIEATNDLKKQFIEMKRQNKTPDDFGMMVKKCPDILHTTLLVTSRNKSRTSIDKVLTLNYSRQVVDTSKIYWDREKNAKNLNVLRTELEKKLGNLSDVNGRKMYRNVGKNTIISILKQFDIPFENNKFDVASICDFLEKTTKLDQWDVVVATGDESKSTKFKFGGQELNPVKRSFTYRSAEEESFVRIAGNNNRLMDPGILNAGLSFETLQDIRDEAGPGKTPTALDYLKYRNIPILVIYPIELKYEEDKPEKREIMDQLNGQYLIGLGIGFPYNGEGFTVQYKINKRRQQELEKEREEMMDGDDDE